jgi:hypothetical protein
MTAEKYYPAPSSLAKSSFIAAPGRSRRFVKAAMRVVASSNQEQWKEQSMTLRNSTLVMAALAAAGFLAAPVEADTLIHAEFIADYDRIRPEPYPGIHLKNSLEVTLSGVNDVKESNTRETGKVSDNQRGMKVLGEKSSDGGSSWRVAGPSRLERVLDQPQSITTMRSRSAAPPASWRCSTG